jgi:hypothetical protein
VLGGAAGVDDPDLAGEFPLRGAFPAAMLLNREKISDEHMVLEADPSSGTWTSGGVAGTLPDSFRRGLRRLNRDCWRSMVSDKCVEW